MMADKSWLTRVNEYLDELEVCVEAMNDALDNTRMGTMNVHMPTVGDGTAHLTECLAALERLIAQRQQLLEAPDVPVTGLTLRDVLNRCILENANVVADRCHQISRSVELTRERAVSLFVCQFHLNELSTHLLALLRTGADHGATYQSGQMDANRTAPTTSVFNRAA